MAGDLRRGGIPVDIREGVIDVVQRMGVLDHIKSASLPPRPVVFVNEDGMPLQQKRHEETSGAPEEGYEIERDALLELLFKEVKGCSFMGATRTWFTNRRGLHG